MINQFIRYYNQNRKKVWTIVLVIVFGIALLQVLNYFAGRNNGTGSGNGDGSSTGTAIYQPAESLVTGDTVSQKTYEKQSGLIDNFIKNCNEGSLQEAYQLLSDDCKNMLFPSLESFTNNYYKLVFSEKRDYSIANWAGNTYQVNMTHDLLATGKSNEGVVTRDYFTIIDQNGESKLNINQFIGSEEISKEKQDDHLFVKVGKRETYMDYEIYSIYVKNMTAHTITLDDLKKSDTIYLTDSEGVTHASYSNEIASNLLVIEAQNSVNLKLKFANPYIQGREIKSLTFSKAFSEYKIDDPFNVEARKRDNFNFTINL